MGSPQKVADYLEEYFDIADIDGFNVGYVISPESFEDLVDLLVPELRKRGTYPEHGPTGTFQQRIMGSEHSRLRDDHIGSKYKYDVYADEEG
jgi:hypothetical protein